MSEPGHAAVKLMVTGPCTWQPNTDADYKRRAGDSTQINGGLRDLSSPRADTQHFFFFKNELESKWSFGWKKGEEK